MTPEETLIAQARAKADELRRAGDLSNDLAAKIRAEGDAIAGLPQAAAATMGPDVWLGDAAERARGQMQQELSQMQIGHNELYQLAGDLAKDAHGHQTQEATLRQWADQATLNYNAKQQLPPTPPGL